MSQYQSTAGPTVPSYDSPHPITAGADARLGKLKSVTQTLTTANAVYTVTLPTGVRGFRLYPTLGDIVFAVGENPAAIGAITGNVVAANFTTGVAVLQYETAVRVLPEANADTLRLTSTTTNAVVRVDTF
jgi:hypothetical protein